MRKPGPQVFTRFLDSFRAYSRALGRRQAVIPYFISGHPGCTIKDMVEVALFLKRHNLRVEQVQEFTPTPGSLSTCIWHTGRDPFTGEPVYVPKSPQERRLQKALLLWHLPEHQEDVREALNMSGRGDAAEELLTDRGRQPRQSPTSRPRPTRPERPRHR
jgi:radical SAM superfamily enzyme YgiQ (UPF0313 family)